MPTAQPVPQRRKQRWRHFRALCTTQLLIYCYAFHYRWKNTSFLPGFGTGICDNICNSTGIRRNKQWPETGSAAARRLLSLGFFLTVYVFSVPLYDGTKWRKSYQGQRCGGGVWKRATSRRMKHPKSFRSSIVFPTKPTKTGYLTRSSQLQDNIYTMPLEFRPISDIQIKLISNNIQRWDLIFADLVKQDPGRAWQNS